MIQLKVWLLLADIYLSMGQPNEAMFCIQEASQIYPLSHQIMYMVSGECQVFKLNFLLLLQSLLAWSSSCLFVSMGRRKTMFSECCIG